ncbi:MAG: hypothetical protein GWP08_10495 [Nitrospiraceae bacterium]|nr:hypothetical protein [Nitrospiraceae bacterium]
MAKRRSAYDFEVSIMERKRLAMVKAAEEAARTAGVKIRIDDDGVSVVDGDDPITDAAKRSALRAIAEAARHAAHQVDKDRQVAYRRTILRPAGKLPAERVRAISDAVVLGSTGSARRAVDANTVVLAVGQEARAKVPSVHVVRPGKKRGSKSGRK